MPDDRSPRRGGGRSSATRGRGGEGSSSLGRVVGSVTYLVPQPAPPATSLAGCLAAISSGWQRQDHLAGLWQAWPRLVGPQLAPHCRPLSLQAGLLTVGAPPGPWLQALQYNRHQMLGALRGAGFAIRDLRVRQHHPQELPTPGSQAEAEIWARHPSRCEVHGMATCGACGRPAPAGEMALWGHCGFCRRAELADQGSPSGR